MSLNVETNIKVDIKSQIQEDDDEEIIIPCNKGYASRRIQLTKPDTHLTIYTIRCGYSGNTETGMRKLDFAIPYVQYPIYVYEDYNLDDFIEQDFEWGMLDYNKRVYFIMEEDEDDNIVALLGMLYCHPECEPDFGNTGEKGFYFDCAKWDYRVEATMAFGKDFMYPLSKNQ